MVVLQSILGFNDVTLCHQVGSTWCFKGLLGPWSTENYLSRKSVKSHRTLKSSATLLWEPQILQGCSSGFNHVAVCILITGHTKTCSERKLLLVAVLGLCP